MPAVTSGGLNLASATQHLHLPGAKGQSGRYNRIIIKLHH